MLFNSVPFLMFFPAVLLVHFVLPRRVRWIWLLVASYYFYMCWNPAYALLMLPSTAVTYLSGLLIARCRVPEETHGAGSALWHHPRIWAALSLIINLGILFCFKYYRFAAENLTALLSNMGISWQPPELDVLLPVGISFYTFQALSYTMDVYRGQVEVERNFFRYALFVSFFPQLVAGPIERSRDLLGQLRQPRPFDPDAFKNGALMMLWGYFQKMVVADRAALLVNQVYGNSQAYAGYSIAVATVAFALQIYCDFGGYSSIALGAAQMLGINLTQNFRQPYLATSVSDFWRRWHISLSTWFRDYLYIPLGGSHCGKWRRYFNLMVTFLASGLWHGASLSMMVWGLLNGVYLCVGKATQDARRKLTRHNPLYHFTPVRRIFQTAVTYLLFTSCIIFFRSSEVFEGSKGIADALYIYGHLFSGWGKLFTAPDAIGRALVSIGLSVQTALVLAVSILVVETLESVQEPVNRTIRKVPIFLRWPLYYALVLGMLFFGSFANSGSIYGRF